MCGRSSGQLCHTATPCLPSNRVVLLRPLPRRRSANTSPPSLIADMLCGALGVIGFSWIASPAATELEGVRCAGAAAVLGCLARPAVVGWHHGRPPLLLQGWSHTPAGVEPHPSPPPLLVPHPPITRHQICMDWLAQLLHLPKCFLSSGGGTVRARAAGPGPAAPPALPLPRHRRPACHPYVLCLPTTYLQGVIQSTASEATLVALLSAKARTLHGRPADDAARLCAYCSDQAHSSGTCGG